MDPVRLVDCWQDDSGGELMPKWPRMPDISIIRDLAIQHLPREYTDIEIEFFAEGAFNKLYTVRSPQILPQYLMRVALPVEPFFKTESESATLKYLRTYTSVPVPNVIAYDSSSQNPLGFEWILLEKVDGIPLSEVWESMDFDSKSRLSRDLGHILQQLSGLCFSEIGNLYFSKIRNRVSNRILSSNGEEAIDGTKTLHRTQYNSGNKDNNDMETQKSVLGSDSTVNLDQGIGSEFVVGRIVSPWFFRDKRVLLPTDRGPFSSSYELMMAKTQIQIERIKNLSPCPSDEYYSETDEELAGSQDKILEVCYDLKAAIPDCFPQSGSGETNTIYHSDLSDRNIIVDPMTYRITGIVDWESVSICPSWETSDYPLFLRGFKVTEPPPVGDPEVDEEALTHFRKDWEKVLLRRIYLESLRNPGTGLSSPPSAQGIITDDDIKHKRFFQSLLYEIEFRWRGVRHWIPQLSIKDWEYIETACALFVSI